ncbi:MAG: M18 family aminopeptidase, partial [Pseudomonadota bacterium]
MTEIPIAPDIREHAQDLLEFIDASPSPWHAVSTVGNRLEKHGFIKLEEKESWSLDPGGRYCVVRDDSSIVVFVVGHSPLTDAGFRIVGAHTDSPGLRVKPNAAGQLGSMTRVGVEVYGGPILATFADRDLSLAGRVNLRHGPGGMDTWLLRFKQPLLRLPNLAIHMNRRVNDDGLKF